MAGYKPKQVPRIRIGDEITMDRWNTIVDAVNRAQPIPGSNGGIACQATPFGTMLWISGIRPGFVAYSNTSIGARSSTSAGSGAVYPVELSIDSSGNGILNTISETVNVWNAASQSIASGKYCWVEPDANGNLFVGPLDC